MTATVVPPAILVMMVVPTVVMMVMPAVMPRLVACMNRRDAERAKRNRQAQAGANKKSVHSVLPCFVRRILAPTFPDSLLILSP